MPPSSRTYLLTGANRGIGLGLATILLSRANTTLIALVREPSHPTSLALAANTHGAPDTTVILLPYEATSPIAAADAITSLVTTHGIDSADVVLANAGAMLAHGAVTELTPAAIAEHMAVNCTAPVLLLQATLPLLRRAAVSRRNHGEEDGTEQQGEKGEAKFIAISSAIGSTSLIDKHLHAPTPAYGLSRRR